MNALPRLASASLIVAVEDRAPAEADLLAIGEKMAEAFSDTEIIIVANGSSGPVSLELKRLTERLPDVTVEFLAERIDHDTALLIGIENAIGDHILVADDEKDVAEVYERLLGHAREGCDVVVARRPVADARTFGDMLERAFVGIYNRLTGGALLREPPAARLYSRAAALYILRNFRAEVLLRSSKVAGGFPAVTFETDALTRRVRRPLGQAISKGMRTLLSSTAFPLRMMTAIGVLGSGVALLYTLYIVGIYLFYRDVQPGWTTLSLQLSFLTFIFCGMFALLAEYIVLIYRASGGYRRPVAREIKSQRSRRDGRINVLDAEGRYHIGREP